MIIYGATDGALPYLLKRVLDDVFVAGNKQMLWFLLWIIIFLAFVRAGFGFVQDYFSKVVGLRVVQDLRNQIGTRLLFLDASFYQKHDTGGLISRVTNDTLLINGAITDAAVTMIKESVRIVALMIAAFWLDPFLAVISFVGVPLGIYPVIRFGKRVKKLTRTGQNQLGTLTSTLHEMIIGHRVIQAFALENKEKARFKNDNQETTDTLSKAAKYDALTRPTTEILASFAIGGIIVYGGLSVMEGVRTQGDFIAFLTALLLLYEPIKKLGKLHNAVQSGIAAAERVFEVIDAAPEIVDAPDAANLNVRVAKVEYNNVSFSYDPLADPVEYALHNINLTINPGETVALVGMSGGGKSTLVNLLPRFYDSTIGTVSIDGVNVKECSLESLRNNIAIVTQNTFLFNDTIFQNIANGRIGASAEDVHAAAKAAHADLFINSLPQGYDTLVGEQGLRLSGGQRARIAIARALLKNAPILILDEATASLDSESEELVQAAIERLMVGRTTLVIAHRLATIRNADRIAVIVDGKIVESGTHQKLLDANGEYAKLYRLQFGHHEEAATASSH